MTRELREERVAVMPSNRRVQQQVLGVAQPHMYVPSQAEIVVTFSAMHSYREPRRTEDIQILRGDCRHVLFMLTRIVRR